MSRDYEKETPSPFVEIFLRNQNGAHLNLNLKSFLFWQNRDEIPVVETLNQKVNYILTLSAFSLQQSNINFSVSNDGIEWSIDFGPDSVTLTVKDLVQEITMTSHKLL